MKHPANARVFGFAATAVHGIRLKTGQYSLGIGKAQKAMLFSIEPLEFCTIPNGYGLREVEIETPGSSATDRRTVLVAN